MDEADRTCRNRGTAITGLAAGEDVPSTALLLGRRLVGLREFDARALSGTLGEAS